ncbi:hypothetical protein JTP77_003480 [Streptomyces sp. S9]|nr:hypothetical protein [Streptomyces sp. S9]
MEALARRGRREESWDADLAVCTRLTLIDQNQYYFRSTDATELAARLAVEALAGHSSPVDRVEVSAIAAAVAGLLRFGLVGALSTKEPKGPPDVCEPGSASALPSPAPGPGHGARSARRLHLTASTLAVRGAAGGGARRLLLGVLDAGQATPVITEELGAGRRVPEAGSPALHRREPTRACPVHRPDRPHRQGTLPSACETIFAVARTAGWTAHTLDE